MFQYSHTVQSVSRVSSAQYLGVNLTENLCWNEHINQICKKANSTLGLLRRILSGCDAKVKDMVYHTLVRPKFKYACCAWNPFMVQRRPARFVLNDYSRSRHVTPMILVGTPLRSPTPLSNYYVLYDLDGPRKNKGHEITEQSSFPANLCIK